MADLLHHRLADLLGDVRGRPRAADHPRADRRGGLRPLRWALIDKGLDPIESLRESSRLTVGHRGELFPFIILAIALNIPGLFALIIGVLITSAVTLIAAGDVYRQLDGSLQPAT